MNSIRKNAKNYPEYDIKLVATVHDECICTCNGAFVNEAGALIRKCMEESVSFAVPITADTDLVDNYGQAK